MPFIGVRISWLMFARNSLLARWRLRRLPSVLLRFLGVLPLGDVDERAFEPFRFARSGPQQGRIEQDPDDRAVTTPELLLVIGQRARRLQLGEEIRAVGSVEIVTVTVPCSRHSSREP